MDEFKKRMCIIGAAGIILYFVFGIFLSHNFDFDSWPVLDNNYLTGRGMYDVQNYYYTPVWGYFIAFISFVGSWFGISPMLYYGDYNVRLDEAGVGTGLISDFGYAMLIKVFMLILILVLSYLVYEFMMDVTENDEKKSILAGVLCLVSPLFIMVVSRTGMFEVSMAIFIMLSIMFLIRGNYVIAGGFWALSVSTKFFTAFFFFILVAYILTKFKEDKKTGYKNIGFAALGAIGAFVIVFLPQMLDGTFMTAIGLYIGKIIPNFNSMIDFYEVGAASGQSLITTLERPYKAMVLIIAFAASLYLAYRYYKNGKDDLKKFTIYLIITAIVIFVIPIGGEQFYVTAVPFLAMGAVLINREFGICAFVSALGLGVASVLSSPYSDILVFQTWISGNIPDITILTTPIALRAVMFAIGCIALALCLYIVLKNKWKELNE